MHPDLSVPNNYACKRRLVNAECCQSIDLDPFYGERLRTWALTKFPQRDMLPDYISRRMGVNVHLWSHPPVVNLNIQYRMQGAEQKMSRLTMTMS